MKFALLRAVPDRFTTAEASPLARWLAVSLLPLAALALSTAAQANTLSITATVAASCTTSGATIAFGSYQSGQVATADVTQTFDISCTPGARVTINLGPGQHSLGTTRRMNNGNGGFLDYNLFLTSARSTVWGDGTFGTAKTIAAFDATGDIVQQVFGRIPGGLTPPPGGYTDTVAISFSF